MDLAIIAFIGLGGYIYYLKKNPKAGAGLVDNEDRPDSGKNQPEVASSQDEVNPGSQ